MRPQPRKEEADSRVEVITPEKALAYLEGNVDNRPLKQHTIKRYVHSMKNGEWLVNGESIKFDENGNLLDGQHRLHAIVQANVAVATFVIRGLRRSVFDTLDTGRVRNAQDCLALKGEKNYTTLSGALRLIVCEEQFGSVTKISAPDSSLITNRDMLDALDRHPKLRESATAMTKMKLMIGRGLACYCHYRFSQVSPVEADRFFSSFIKGANLAEGSPILALRNKIAANPNLGSHGRIALLAWVIKAWNAYRKDKQVWSIRWQEGEEFPKIL